jgi:hypothetical protein
LAEREAKMKAEMKAEREAEMKAEREAKKEALAEREAEREPERRAEREAEAFLTVGDKWEKRYAELCEFKRIHGHCEVPQAYSDNPRLGKWVNRVSNK